MACAAAGMLSPVGRCKTLDASADGYVRAEACAGIKMVCKPNGPPASATTPTHSTAFAIVLSGAAVNQDGKSSSLTSPNGPAQSRVIAEAIAAAAANPKQVVSLSMHGTGTALGDPIEVGAAIGALRGYLPDEGLGLNDDDGSACAFDIDASAPAPLLRLTALKSHRGHSESASGALGLVSVISGLLRTNGPDLNIAHLRSMNPFVVSAARSANAGAGAVRSYQQQGLIVANRQTAPSINVMQSGEARKSGISAFGFSGTNAHVVVEKRSALTDIPFSSHSSCAVMTTTSGRLSDSARFWVLPTPCTLLCGGHLATSSSRIGQRCLVQVDVEAVARAGLDAASPAVAFATALAATSRIAGWDAGTTAERDHARWCRLLRKINLSGAATFDPPGEPAGTITCGVDEVSGQVDVQLSLASSRWSTPTTTKLLEARVESVVVIAHPSAPNDILTREEDLFTILVSRAQAAAVAGSDSSSSRSCSRFLNSRNTDEDVWAAAHLSAAFALFGAQASCSGSQPTAHRQLTLIETAIGNVDFVGRDASGESDVSGWFSATDIAISSGQSGLIHLRGALALDVTNVKLGVMAEVGVKIPTSPPVNNNLPTQASLLSQQHQEEEIDAFCIRARVLTAISKVLDDGGGSGDAGHVRIDGAMGLIEAGLDSLGVTELRSALLLAIPGLSLPTTLMYDCPTVNDLVRLVTSRVIPRGSSGGQGTEAESNAELIAEPLWRNRPESIRSASMDIRAMPADQSAATTLTREQYLFWSHSLMFPSSCAYNMGFVLHFDEDVDDGDLAKSLGRVVQMHPSLLVHISSDGTKQVQPTVSQWKSVLARSTEVRQLPGLATDTTVSRVENGKQDDSRVEARVTVDHPAVVAACSEAFNITEGAPLRFYRAGKRALLLVVHHVVCDASSLSLLAQQLRAAHSAIRAARLRGVNDKLNPPRIDQEFGFFAHAASQARQSTADLVEKIDHWEELLTSGRDDDGVGSRHGGGGGGGGKFQPLNLRLDYPPLLDAPATLEAKRPCASIAIDISPELATALRSGAAREGRTAFSTLISAWALTLRRQAETAPSWTSTGMEQGQSKPEHQEVNDLVFGTAFDLRGMTGLSTSETVGCFSTLLPVRCNLRAVSDSVDNDADNGGEISDVAFGSLAAHMHRVCQAAFKHPDVPLLGIIERLMPPRRAGGGNPLFSTCFSFVSLPRFSDMDASVSIPDVTAVRFHEAAFELWLGIGEIAKGGMKGNLMYDTTVFSRRTAAAIASSFEACLERAVAEPETTVGDLDAHILTARHASLAAQCIALPETKTRATVNRLCGPEDYAATRVVSESAPLGHVWRFLERAVSMECVSADSSNKANTMAIRDFEYDTVMSYADLEAHSRALAAILLHSTSVVEGMVESKSARPRVSVIAPNGWSIMAVHFAAALVGGVVGNHNTHLVAPELAHQFERFQPHAVAASADLNAVTDAALGLVTGAAKRIYPLRIPMPLDAADLHVSLGRVPAALPPSFYAERVGRGDFYAAADPFMLYFTSGTSGKPKGVMLSQDVVCRHAVGTMSEMRLHAHDVWLHAAPMFHLVDAFAIYAVTGVKAQHVLQSTFEAAATLHIIEREGVTVMNVASTMITLICASPQLVNIDLTSLRLVSCGGSPVADAVVKRAIASFGCEFFVSYGMTECCGKISMSLLEPAQRSNEVSALNGTASVFADQLETVCSSGRAFRLQTIRVVSEDGAIVSPGSGIVGEVQCRGPTVFDGYLNDPAANAKSFVDPESSNADTNAVVYRWFRTGDLATVDARGYLRIVDRKTDMILVGGENVYTAEVESALHSHPAVKQAAVFGVDQEIMGQMVHAAVVLRQTNVAVTVTAQELIAHVRGLLSAYKVPAVLNVVESLPTGGSGKVLKTKLREMASGARGGFECKQSPHQRMFDARVQPEASAVDAGPVSLLPLYNKYTVEWVAMAASRDWTPIATDASRVQIVIDDAATDSASDSSDSLGDVWHLLEHIKDSLGDINLESSHTDVIVSSTVLPSLRESKEDIADLLNTTTLTGLLRGVIADRQRGHSIRHVRLLGGASIRDVTPLPPASIELEVCVLGSRVFVPRLAPLDKPHNVASTGPVCIAESSNEAAHYLLVVESAEELASGGLAAAAVGAFASRSACRSIAIWTPQLAVGGSAASHDIDEVLVSAVADVDVRVTMTAVDVRDDAQVARACELLWLASASEARAVDTIFDFRGGSSGARSSPGVYVENTETVIALDIARGRGLAAAVSTLSPSIFASVSVMTEEDVSGRNLVARSIQDEALSRFLLQSPPKLAYRFGAVTVSMSNHQVSKAGVIEIIDAAEASARESGRTSVDQSSIILVASTAGAVGVEGAASSLGVKFRASRAKESADLDKSAVMMKPNHDTDQFADITIEDVQERVISAASLVLVPQSGERLQPMTSLWDMGMNSILAVSLASALEAEFQVSLPASVAFDYGTLSDLARFIHGRYFAQSVQVAAPQVRHRAPQWQHRAVAIAAGKQSDAEEIPIPLPATGPTLEDMQRRVVRAASTVLASDTTGMLLAPTTSLWDVGMNSVLAVSLASALEREFQVRLPASVAFDYGTLSDLARFIHRQFFAAAASVAARDAPASQAVDPLSQAIHHQRKQSSSGAASAAAVSAGDTTGHGNLTRRTTTPIRRRVSRKLSRTVSAVVPEPDPPTVREVVLSVLTHFLPHQSQQFASELVADTHSLGGYEQLEFPNAPSLWSMGLSSVTAVQLVTNLSDRVNLALPPTLLFDYPTVSAVVKYVEARNPPGLVVSSNLSGSETESAAQGGVVTTVARSVSSWYSSSYGCNRCDPAVLVTDLSTTLAESAAGTPMCPSDNIHATPSARWDPDQSEDQSLHVVESRFGHFLPNVGDIDTAYFGYTPAEAILMDPQQRLLLHQCNRPATVGRIPNAHFGVYVAISQFEYAIDVQTHGHFVAYAATGSAHSVACGRLSYTFGLSGPCLSVDTACSSVGTSETRSNLTFEPRLSSLNFFP